MFKATILLFIGCLILSFQNCARSGLGGDSPGANNLNQIAVGNAVLAPTNESLTPVTAVEIPTRSGAVTVDVDSGRISFVDPQTQVAEISCLSPNDLAELQSYLSAYTLCAPNSGAADQICTQQYTAPYAKLVLAEQKLNLGEAFDGCGKGTRDLCGAAQPFHNIVDYIAKNFPSMKCQ